MDLKRPKPVYINVRDGKTGRSKTLTVYGGTRDAVVTRIRQMFEQSSASHAESSATAAN